MNTEVKKPEGEDTDFGSTFDQLAEGASMDDIPLVGEGTADDDAAATNDEGAVTAEGDAKPDESEQSTATEEEGVQTGSDESVSDAEGSAEATTSEDEAGADTSTADDTASTGELDSLKSTNADLVARIAALEAKPAAVTPVAAEPAPAAAEPEPIYTEDENTALAKYREDWPDVAAGEALARKQDMVTVADYILDQVAKAYGPTVDYVNNRSGSDQYNSIVQLVPDYDQVRDKAIAWIDTQPGILKKAYNSVVESGSAADVAEFIGRYKQETGYSAEAPTTAAAAPAAATKPQTGAATKKAATALKSVKSTRGSVTAEPDDNDFSGSFDEFSKAK